MEAGIIEIPSKQYPKSINELVLHIEPSDVSSVYNTYRINLSKELNVGVEGLEPPIYADYQIYSLAPNQFGITPGLIVFPISQQLET